MRQIHMITAGALLAIACSSQAHARELRAISAYAPNYSFTVNILKPFLEAIEKETDGELTFNLSGPETVAPFEQFQPMQAGVFDLLFTHPSYHSGTTTLGMGIDATTADPAMRRETGLFGYIADYYRENHNVELVSAPPIGTDGFRVFLREPITGEPGLQGKKTRGTASHQALIRELGGSPINMPGGDVYTALQRGVIDAAIWTTTGVVDFKLHEVADYYSEPAFGQVGVMVFFNGDTWSSLTEEQRATIGEIARHNEISSVQVFDELGRAELDKLKELGMEATPFPETEAGKLDQLWAESVWEAAGAQATDETDELRALAKEHGLTD